MNYTTLEEALEQAGLPVEMDAFSVYRAFEQIQDGRHKRGVRYSSALMVTLIVLARIGGDDDPGWHSRMGAVAGGMVEPGIAQSTWLLSVRGDLQQCLTDVGCPAGDPGAGRTS